jgi:hypothetical protein
MPTESRDAWTGDWGLGTLGRLDAWRVFAPADTLEGCGYTNQVRLRGLRKNKVWLPGSAGFVRIAPGFQPEGFWGLKSRD